eukprot:Nk52_evm1s808 gene=Nk52_evmTU1s808
MLKRSLSNGTKDWPNHLAFISNALNNTVSRTTKFSPSQLALGRSTTVFDYDDSRHRNSAVGNNTENVDWKSYIDLIRGIIYPLVCNNIRERREEVNDERAVKPMVSYKKYDLVYISRRSMINPLNKGRIQEFNKGPCIILKGEKYDNCDDIHKYTVKYLTTGQVYTGIHYRRILKVNPNAIPTFPSLEGH